MRFPFPLRLRSRAIEAAREALRTGVSLYRVARYTRRLPDLPQTSRDTSVVVGNGPSLFASLEGHVEWLSETPCWCVSTFASTPFFERIRPQYYVFADHAWWEDVVSSEIADLRRTTYREIEQRTKWPMTLFFPAEAGATEYFRRSIARLNNVAISFFNSTRLTSFNPVVFELYRRQLGIPTGGNVLISALYLALTVGLRQIYLVGADHSWLEDMRVNDDNVVCLRQKHFSSDDRVELKPFEKFHDASEFYTMSEALRVLADLFNGYQEISKYAQRLGAHIVNATPNSYIDAFDRGSLPTVAAKAAVSLFPSGPAGTEQPGQRFR
jgi:hypothetical protein